MTPRLAEEGSGSDPKDPEAAYTVGVIDWTQAHENMLKALRPAGVNDDGEGNAKAPKKVMEHDQGGERSAGRRRLAVSESGSGQPGQLRRCHGLPEPGYRRKADVDYGNDAARKADLAQAEEWRTKAMGTRKANEEKKNKGPGGITMDSSGNLK